MTAPQTGGSGWGKGKPLAAPAEPCDYAACDVPAVTHADGWAFCRQHIREHNALKKDEERVFVNGRVFRVLKPCGTTAAAKRHRRRGEDVCDACHAAERAKYGYKSTSKRWAS